MDRPTSGASLRRPEVPPPGRQLAFGEYARLVTRVLRRDIPEVRAAATGSHRVVWRHGGRVATLTDDAGTHWFRFGSENGAPTTMASLYDRDRRDAFTAGNFARSLAGYFDARFSVAR